MNSNSHSNIHIPKMAVQKIVSLVPSLTELLIDLGLSERLVGRTRFCIHPANEVAQIPIIGGTKNPNIEKIISLEPDYILANKEENRQEDIEELQKHCNVHLTDINTIPDALAAITEIGKELDVEERAHQISRDISLVLNQKPSFESLKTAYFIWREPWMVAGSETYIHDVMREWNLENAFDEQPRYPEIDLDELQKSKPDLILLSSEPYPFKEKHISEIKKYCPNATIELINGEWFSWYGSGMIQSFKALTQWRKGLRAN